jgi:hypothetical protein
VGNQFAGSEIRNLHIAVEVYEKNESIENSRFAVVANKQVGLTISNCYLVARKGGVHVIGGRNISLYDTYLQSVATNDAGDEKAAVIVEDEAEAVNIYNCEIGGVYVDLKYPSAKVQGATKGVIVKNSSVHLWRTTIEYTYGPAVLIRSETGKRKAIVTLDGGWLEGVTDVQIKQELKRNQSEEPDTFMMSNCSVSGPAVFKDKEKRKIYPEAVFDIRFMETRIYGCPLKYNPDTQLFGHGTKILIDGPDKHLGGKYKPKVILDIPDDLYIGKSFRNAADIHVVRQKA